MELWPMSIAEREAEILYPQLPEEYRKQKTKEEFIVFFEQFFILTGDLESGDKASKTGEKHGFVNNSACAFFDDDECGYVCFVSPGRGCQKYIQRCLEKALHCTFDIS